MDINNWNYCNDFFNYKKFISREVNIGDVPLGGDNPIRIQSMTTTDTMDTIGTVEQSIRMIEAGCEYIRITAPSLKEAENLRNIKAELRARGYNTPLIADIHFTPNAAELAARIVEKVRINPGNYVDKKKFQIIEYTDAQYQEELERIREKFTPFVKICKEYGTAIRIGTNHGSLSDRILSRYGDTPEGMVESAMEFLRIAEENNYHNIVLSMKASNTQVMVQAYRLLVNQMMQEGMSYPLHLGVTEAGDGEDGRIKSAVGIGTLLEDGLGDTIRVSLTEDPEKEAPVALHLAKRYKNRAKHQPNSFSGKSHIYPFQYKKRESIHVGNVGATEVPRVVADLSGVEDIKPAHFFPLGYQYSVPLDKWNITDLAVDYVFVGDKNIQFEIPGTLQIVQNYTTWLRDKKAQHIPLLQVNDLDNKDLSSVANWVYLNLEDYSLEVIQKIAKIPNVVLIAESGRENFVQHVRGFFNELLAHQIKIPVIVKQNNVWDNPDQYQLYTSTDFGALFLDGLGDGIWVNNTSIALKNQISTVFGILQASRTRISKTEYISCPSCGRTLFDLQETTAMIRSKTSHLKGVKIGIMGCIVNGPGEMADADYGYVGSGVGKITLYKGQEVVKKSIPSENAVNELIQLIKDHGDWIEAPVLE